MIATARGGARETVVDGVTGFLVDAPTPGGFAEAMQAAGERSWDSAAIQAHARTFSTEAFQRKLIDQVARDCGLG